MADDPKADKPAIPGPTPEEALVVALILQVLGWLAFGSFMTSRPLHLYYYFLVTGYWLAISIICLVMWPIATRRFFSTLIIVTCWIPVAWCALWMFEVYPFFGWPEWGRIK